MKIGVPPHDWRRCKSKKMEDSRLSTSDGLLLLYHWCTSACSGRVVTGTVKDVIEGHWTNRIVYGGPLATESTRDSLQPRAAPRYEPHQPLGRRHEAVCTFPLRPLSMIGSGILC